MRIAKVDDYQTWLLEAGDVRILVDPWLTSTMTFPMGMFHRTRIGGTLDDLRPTHVVITAPFGDHLHRPSLALLDRSIPVLTTYGAAKQVRRMGFEDIRAFRDGDSVALDSRARLQFVAAGFPYAFNTLGLLLEESGDDAMIKRVYLEAHVISARTLDTLPRPLDALVTTTQSVRLFGIQLGMDVQRAARSAVALAARRLVATGVDPQKARGVLSRLLYIRGDALALEAAMTATGATIPQDWLTPGQSIDL